MISFRALVSKYLLIILYVTTQGSRFGNSGFRKPRRAGAIVFAVPLPLPNPEPSLHRQ
jgi:hypothetical protein